MKCNQSRPGFELVSQCPFPTTITITQRVPPVSCLFFNRFLHRSFLSNLHVTGINCVNKILTPTITIPPRAPPLFSPPLRQDMTQGPDTYLSFRFLLILLCGGLVWQSPLFGRFYFFFFYFFFSFFFFFFFFLSTILMSGHLLEIKWSVCISKSRQVFSFHFPGRISVEHIPFVRMVKLNFLAPFPVDHLPLPVSFFLYCLRVFQTIASWWSFTEVWVTSSFFSFPGLLSLHWPISTMQ